MESTSIEGTKLACMFSWDCQTARKREINSQLTKFIIDPQNPEEMQQILQGLASYYGYVQLAAKYGLDPFAMEVVSAYWLGNKQLDEVFRQRGGDKGIDFPYHNYHVLAKFRPSRLNSHLLLRIFRLIAECTVQTALVVEIRRLDYRVIYQPINWSKEKGFHFGNLIRRDIKRGLLGEARIDDIIVFHFSSARIVVNEATRANLLRYTQLTFDSLNAK